MGLKQKKALAKKESGDLKVDKTSKAGYDRSNVAEVIKRLKKMAKEDTNRFDKMGLDETLERLEASERVAASVDVRRTGCDGQGKGQSGMVSNRNCSCSDQEPKRDKAKRPCITC